MAFSLLLSYSELNLLLFALQYDSGVVGSPTKPGEVLSCEEVCPVAEKFEQALYAAVPREKQLVRHLSDHLRHALLECGILELAGVVEEVGSRPLSKPEAARAKHVNHQLASWTCEMKFAPDDVKLLSEAISRLPRSAWLSMPRSLFRLRRKIRRFL